MTSTLRIVQLNAGTLLEPDWENRRFELLAWLDDLAPDVVCLEEVWEDDSTPNAGAWIADQRPDDGWHVFFGGGAFPESFPVDPSLRFGSCVLSQWPIDFGEFHRLPVLDDPDDRMVGVVPWGLVHARTAGLDVFACHLASNPRHGRHRQRQVLAIDEIIRAAAPPPGRKAQGATSDGMPPILCGDFNAEPGSDEIRFLSSLTAIDDRTTYFQDAWRVAGPDDPGYTQDWRRNPSAGDLNVPRKRIDYVFVGDAFQRTGSAGRVLDAQLCFDTPKTGRLASDHFGLVVEVVWPDRPA